MLFRSVVHRDQKEMNIVESAEIIERKEEMIENGEMTEKEMKTEITDILTEDGAIELVIEIIILKRTKRYFTLILMVLIFLLKCVKV